MTPIQRQLHEVHKRFAMGVLLRLQPEELRPFVTGVEGSEEEAQ